MDNRLRVTLLSNILSSNGIYQHKYSDAYYKLKSIIELEKNEKETKNKLSKDIFKEFSEIELMKNNLSPKIKGMPLLIVEQYFMRNTKNLEKYINMDYEDVSYSDFQVMHIYIFLEKFFEKIYLLASKIADCYALEIKLKNNSKEQDKNDFI